MELIIDQYVTLHQGITADEGKKIYNKIITSFKNGEVVVLNFENLELLTTAFLNVVIGNLYAKYSSEEIKKMLVLKGYSESIAMRIKNVTDTAKQFYANKKKFRNRINNNNVNELY